jgi:hypothetical protein
MLCHSLTKFTLLRINGRGYAAMLQYLPRKNNWKRLMQAKPFALSSSLPLHRGKHVADTFLHDTSNIL